jgi:hypothetical protein
MTNFLVGNILSVLMLLLLVGFIIVYRHTVKTGLKLFGESLFFIYQNPAVLIFAIMRLILCALLDIAFLAWFFPETGWRAFITHPIQKLVGLFEHMCLPGVPYGVIILFLFFTAGLLMSVATIHYVLARLQQRIEPSPYSINVAISSLPQISIWSVLYAIVYFGIVTKQLFLLPIMTMLTFFVPAAIAQGSTNFANSLIKSVQMMRDAFGKTVIFLLLFGLLELILGVGTLQKSSVLSIVLYLLLAIFITLRDVFKAMVVYRMDAKFK